jgi:ribonuclease HI
MILTTDSQYLMKGIAAWIDECDHSSLLNDSERMKSLSVFTGHHV